MITSIVTGFHQVDNHLFIYFTLKHKSIGWLKQSFTKRSWNFWRKLWRPSIKSQENIGTNVSSKTTALVKPQHWLHNSWDNFFPNKKKISHNLLKKKAIQRLWQWQNRQSTILEQQGIKKIGKGKQEHHKQTTSPPPEVDRRKTKNWEAEIR